MTLHLDNAEEVSQQHILHPPHKESIAEGDENGTTDDDSVKASMQQSSGTDSVHSWSETGLTRGCR